MRVLDLGSSPGGWAQVAVEETKSTDENPLVFCVDEKPMPDLLGTRFLQKDINEEGTPNAVLNFVRDPVDVVLSDVVH
jgi:23S rRNA (uridine2552-2'-O)-methyltransferase